MCATRSGWRTGGLAHELDLVVDEIVGRYGGQARKAFAQQLLAGSLGAHHGRDYVRCHQSSQMTSEFKDHQSS